MSFPCSRYTETQGFTVCVEQLKERVFKAPCKKLVDSFEKAQKHVRRCKRCNPMVEVTTNKKGAGDNKRRKMASKELLGTPDAPGAEVTIPGAETAEATVSGNVTVTEVEEADLVTGPVVYRGKEGVKVPRSVPQNWPRGINSETHQEWDDSDLGISDSMNAIFTAVICQDPNGSSVQVGLTAGSGSIQVDGATRIFLDMESVKTARDQTEDRFTTDLGDEFSEVLLLFAKSDKLLVLDDEVLDKALGKAASKLRNTIWKANRALATRLNSDATN
ncbi:hypothetical protein BGX31_001804 [Mortierella sp. GBA43]|nr:hypothetical protein BGX31_001804 [Mortierella sp. GBA43]